MTTDPGAEGREGVEEVTTMTLYKVLGSDAQSIHNGTATWYKPHGQRPGKWMPAVGNLRCCIRGYHLVELWSLTDWLRDGCTIWVAEGKGTSHGDGSGKTAFAQARLLRQIHISDRDLRLFACDCAERTLPNFEKQFPNDDRPRKAIEAARAVALAEPGSPARSAESARAAARVAAESAAWAAAESARAAASAAGGGVGGGVGGAVGGVGGGVVGGGVGAGGGAGGGAVGAGGGAVGGEKLAVRPPLYLFSDGMTAALAALTPPTPEGEE